MDVWKEHAKEYLDEIIEAVEGRPNKITKVRAGYLLNEFLALSDPRVENWVQYARRGGTSLLNPSAPFASNFSEKWMLSLNVN
jgi:predicted transcriptional regulator of viral defense system